ncbi:hypothetical protein [Cardinium endosymbiont of Philonthus spinipes]|uniref:hypothetical protein n=1 Tax=Cardinium endosymbiont of Philonthus spinipes TaxID=3077941 RepID=UPI00313C6DF6
MEEQIEIQRKKLLISFSGCTKDDTDKTDKSNSTDRVGTGQGTYGISNPNGHSEQYASQLSYKF